MQYIRTKLISTGFNLTLQKHTAQSTDFILWWPSGRALLKMFLVEMRKVWKGLNLMMLWILIQEKDKRLCWSCSLNKGVWRWKHFDSHQNFGKYDNTRGSQHGYDRIVTDSVVGSLYFQHSSACLQSNDSYCCMFTYCWPAPTYNTDIIPLRMFKVLRKVAFFFQTSPCMSA